MAWYRTTLLALLGLVVLSNTSDASCERALGGDQISVRELRLRLAVEDSLKGLATRERNATALDYLAWLVRLLPELQAPLESLLENKTRFRLPYSTRPLKRTPEVLLGDRLVALVAKIHYLSTPITKRVFFHLRPILARPWERETQLSTQKLATQLDQIGISHRLRPKKFGPWFYAKRTSAFALFVGIPGTAAFLLDAQARDIDHRTEKILENAVPRSQEIQELDSLLDAWEKEVEEMPNGR